MSEIWRCWEAERLLERPRHAGALGWVLIGLQLVAAIALTVLYLGTSSS